MSPYRSSPLLTVPDTITVSPSVWSIARRLKETFEEDPRLISDPDESGIVYQTIGDRGREYILRLQRGPKPDEDVLGVIFGVDETGTMDLSKYAHLHLTDTLRYLYPGEIPYLDGSAHPIAFGPTPELMRWIEGIIGSGSGPFGPTVRQLVPGYSLVLHRDTFARYKIARLYNEDRNGIPATSSHFWPIRRREGRAELGPVVWYEKSRRSINEAIVSLPLQWGDSRRLETGDLLGIESVMIKALEAGAFRSNFARLTSRLGTRYLLRTHPASDFPGLRVDGETPYIVCDVRLLTRLGSLYRYSTSRLLLALMDDLSIEVAEGAARTTSAVWVAYSGDLLKIEDAALLPEIDRRFLASLAIPLSGRLGARS